MMLSKSAMKLYLRCPLAYRYSYIDQRTPARSRGGFAGRDLHEIFNLYFDHFEVRNGLVMPTFHFPKEYAGEFGIFVSMESARYRELKDKSKFIPIVRERDFHNGRMGIHGIVDRVDDLGDGCYNLIEYKSGNIPPTEAYKELAFYTHVLDGHIPITDWSIFYVSRGDVLGTHVDERVMREVSDDIKKVQSGISKGRFPAHRSPDSCYICGYKAICPEWKV